MEKSPAGGENLSDLLQVLDGRYIHSVTDDELAALKKALGADTVCSVEGNYTPLENGRQLILRVDPQRKIILSCEIRDGHRYEPVKSDPNWQKHWEELGDSELPSGNFRRKSLT